MDRKAVLVCANARHVARLIEVNLKRQGHDVHIANDGEAVLAELVQYNFGLLILDRTLTCPSAQEILDRMTEIPGAENVHVILIPPNDDDGPGHGSDKGTFPPAPAVLATVDFKSIFHRES